MADTIISSDSRISVLFSMSVDHQQLLDYYENVYELMSYEGEPEDIEENYSDKYVATELGADPTLQGLVSAVPVASGCEYAGYFRDGQLFYIKCEASSAHSPDHERFVFHTHPRDHSVTDMPSEGDLYGFLHNPNAVSLTVGRNRHWFMIKTAETMEKVEMMRAWKEDNLLSVLLKLHDQQMSTFEIREHAPALILEKAFNYATPNTVKFLLCFDWQNEVTEKLGIKLLVFENTQGGI
jgi:hypothetical protein